MKKTIRLVMGLSLASVGLGGMTAVHGTALAAPQSTITHLSKVGDSSIGAANKTGPDTSTLNLQDETLPDLPDLQKTGNTPPAQVPPVAPWQSVSGAGVGFSGFNGLNHRDSREAGTGQYVNTQPSLEPPDQGLCVGNGYVLEAVNDALAIYNTAGQLQSGPTAINQFLLLRPEHNRVTGVFGDFVSDPRCYYDRDTQRWFFTALQMGLTQQAQYEGPSHIEVAVSKTANPTQGWSIFTIDTTEAAVDPNHPGCPCFGDQPLIGADRYGFYVSTNEYPIPPTPGFNGAQIYAFSKSQLEQWANGANTQPPVVHFFGMTLPDLSGNAQASYSIQPSNSFSTFAMDNSQTEYFLSALQFEPGGFDNRIAVWKMMGTASLNNPTPSVTLSYQILGSESYGNPPPATQKPGPTPLDDSLCGGQCPLNIISTNDDRMNEVVWADGKLWSGVNTAVAGNGPFGALAGIAYFVVNPGMAGAAPTMAAQGYVATANENVYYPAIAVNSSGKGEMGFTLSGPDYWPSTAYISMTPQGAVGPIHIAGAGWAPADGFTGYEQGIERWGDYGYAAVDSAGTIWLGNEYIPPQAGRTQLANWGTYVSHITPS